MEIDDKIKKSTEQLADYADDILNEGLTGKPTNQGTSSREKDKQKEKTPRKKLTTDDKILQELKNIRRLLALPMKKYNVEDKDDAKFIERMNK